MSEETKNYGVEYSEYKGYDMIEIWELDKEGAPTSKFPVVSMGKRKAKAVVAKIEEVEAFANS